jgi:hypothetical protein
MVVYNWFLGMSVPIPALVGGGCPGTEGCYQFTIVMNMLEEVIPLFPSILMRTILSRPAQG